MKHESEPVASDEFVLRLIWRDFLRFGERLIVTPTAFRPRKDETDGISAFRASCLGNPRDALAVILPEKQGKYAIAILAVSELIALGLDVRPAKVDTVPGHAVIPELNISAVAADKSRWEIVRGKLAQLAELNLILPTELKSR